jgi:heme exporter protein A
MSRMTTINELRSADLAVWRAERCLFERLDFALLPEQLAVVVGPNGAGKTTLLRVLAGLATPTYGDVTWRGRAVSALRAEERAQIAYRGHHDGLKRELTLMENLAFHAAVWQSGLDLRALAEQAGLTSAAETRARYLSAGQRRRAALATLKLSAARLWILDEPTTNLDADGRRLLGNWIATHRREGGSVVVASHQPEEFMTSGTLVIEL